MLKYLFQWYFNLKIIPCIHLGHNSEEPLVNHGETTVSLKSVEEGLPWWSSG